MEKVRKEARRKLDLLRKLRRWHKLVTVMAGVVVFCTTYALILPAITMTTPLVCEKEEHTHTDECYQIEMVPAERKLICELPEAEGHTHTDDCWTEVTVPACGLEETEGHTHTDNCYTEITTYTCGLEEIEGHAHTAACYTRTQGDLLCDKEFDTVERQVETVVERSAVDENGETVDAPETVIETVTETVPHVHTDDCYAWTEELTCSLEETEGHAHTDECAQTERVLTCELVEAEPHIHTEECGTETQKVLSCGLEETEGHAHTDECYEIPGNEGELVEVRTLVCEKEEHTHDDNCYYGLELEEKVKYYCGFDTQHTHDESCWFEDGALKCNIPEHTHTDECLVEPENALLSLRTDRGPTLKISLLQSDQKEHEDAFAYYTYENMTGYIKLEPNELLDNLSDVTVSLIIPKEYVDVNSVKIPEFNSNSTITEYTILPVEEDGDNYYAKIQFAAYDKTQTLVLPFALSFKDRVVPDNYDLYVTANVACESSGIDNSSLPNIYEPLYRDWYIKKFVNSNKLDEFGNKGTKVYVASQEAVDDTYVEFFFRVNSVINSGSDLNSYRDASAVTLTDTLPTYTDKNGESKTAAFDPEVNPGWTLSADGTTVSKTYTGENSSDVLLQIYNDAPLKLRFPGLLLEQDPRSSKNLIANLENKVDLLAIPSNEIEGETRPTANAPLNFVISTDPSTNGQFSKSAMKANIYDTEKQKDEPLAWRIRLSNKGIRPLEHVQIQDRRIVDEETGKIELYGPDEELKFVRLESDLRDSIPATGRSFADMVDKVIAYYTDGTTQDFLIDDQVIDEIGNFVVEFDEDRECNGYNIVFKDDYQLPTNERVSFKAYTVHHDSKTACVPEGTESRRYENSARSVNSYPMGDGDWEFTFLTSAGGYNVLHVTEELKIRKETWFNSANQNSMAGDKYFYYCYLTGSLMTPEQKEYEDICVIDLLPNEVDYVRTTNGWGEFINGGVPEIVENYHNSGRTALIFRIKAETLTRRWAEGWNGLLSFEVQIRKDAGPGTVRNDIYVVGGNLGEYTDAAGGTLDIYDLNNNGRTDDMVAYSSSNAIIVAAASTYAEKFIAPAGSDNWNKQGLSLNLGSDFDYLLKVTNQTTAEHAGLTVYDTLPASGDLNIYGTESRNTEIPVCLREEIIPPAGYSIYYTTDKDAPQKDMNTAVESCIWLTSGEIKDWSDVTAFMLKADSGVMLRKEEPFEVRIPVHVGEALDEESKQHLEAKGYQDAQSGTVAYLQANNSFGFTHSGTTSPKESNTVWARVLFAGFTVKKVDSESKEGLEGAQFTLYKDGVPIQTKTSDKNGFLSFRELDEGEYTLTETKTPDGYLGNQVSLKVSITQNPVSMEYTVKFQRGFTGAGTSSDPLLIENVFTQYVLPATGGSGTTLWYTMGTMLLLGAAYLMYKKRQWLLREEDAM